MRSLAVIAGSLILESGKFKPLPLFKRPELRTRHLIAVLSLAVMTSSTRPSSAKTR